MIMLVRLDGHVARLRLNLTEPKRVDRIGLWVEYDVVKSASARGLRQQLEALEPRLAHLCRPASCRG